MNWGSVAEFFAMGGYGLYVWGAYGLTAALLAFEAWSARRRHRRALDAANRATLARLEGRR